MDDLDVYLENNRKYIESNEKHIADMAEKHFKYKTSRFDWIDLKMELRATNLLIYQNRLLFKELDMDEDDYPIDW